MRSLRVERLSPAKNWLSLVLYPLSPPLLDVVRNNNNNNYTLTEFDMSQSSTVDQRRSKSGRVNDNTCFGETYG
jgi:hypothetical protein